jgi:hypothetical protein
LNVARRYNAPSIDGTADFDQYSANGSGSSPVDMSCHFSAWSNMGYSPGNHDYQVVAVEGWSNNTGSASVSVSSADWYTHWSDGGTAHFTCTGITNPTPDPTTTPGPTTVPTAAPTATPVPTPDQTMVPTPTPGNGDGLTGQYYNNSDFTSLVLTRVDQTIDFNWGGGSPDSSMDSETYSIRWTGKVEPYFSENYTFYINTDDGVRLRVNNQLIIDNWVEQAATEVSGTINLNAGTQYDKEMEYYESSGDAVAQLSWSSLNNPKEIIPRSQLFSGGVQDNLGDTDSDGEIDIVDALLVAQYYVDLNPSNFNPANADTNCDGTISIVDALLIAQFYVDLITGFC